MPASFDDFKVCLWNGGDGEPKCGTVVPNGKGCPRHGLEHLMSASSVKSSTRLQAELPSNTLHQLDIHMPTPNPNAAGGHGANTAGKQLPNAVITRPDREWW